MRILQGVVSNLQDLVLLLVSSIFFLLLVLDAFYHENAYQLLVSMASGGINLAQLIVYAVCMRKTDGCINNSHCTVFRIGISA